MRVTATDQADLVEDDFGALLPTRVVVEEGSLTGHQLDEILHKATEQAEAEAKAAQPTQSVTREKMNDLKGALRSIADWRRNKRNNN